MAGKWWCHQNFHVPKMEESWTLWGWYRSSEDIDPIGIHVYMVYLPTWKPMDAMGMEPTNKKTPQILSMGSMSKGKKNCHALTINEGHFRGWILLK